MELFPKGVRIHNPPARGIREVDKSSHDFMSDMFMVYKYFPFKIILFP